MNGTKMIPGAPRQHRIYTYGIASMLLVLVLSALTVSIQMNQFAVRHTTDDMRSNRPFHATKHAIIPPSLVDWVHAGVLITNSPEHTARRAHYEQLVREVGYFYPIRFESVCPDCEADEGAILSHVRLLWRISQESHDNYVVVLDDDVELAQVLRRDQFVSCLDDQLRRVMQPRDGFVYLGVYSTPEMERSCLERSCASSSMHAYMVTPWGARAIVQRLEQAHGTYSPADYRGQSIDLSRIIGPSPVLGWNYTHDYLMTGWRGLLYPARVAPWRIAPPSNASGGLKVSVSHLNKNDLLGSFVTPSLFLYAIACHHGWTMEIMPYEGSDGEYTLKENLALGDKIDATWGSGFQDTTYRADWDPLKLNREAYDTMGFFPPISHNFFSKEWISVNELPLPGDALMEKCRRHNHTHYANKECNILLPDDPYVMEGHMEKLGGYDVVLNDKFRKRARTAFLEKNKHRLQHFSEGGYNVAVHIRRGDITAEYRWTEQSVFARLARHVCRTHPEANIHVFSSGKNRDGNWSTMEELTTEDETGTKCASVSVHLDELEFDTWAHMIQADVFIMSKSNFGLIPSLLTRGEVYYPNDYWHLRLLSFHIYDPSNGEIIQ